ncbi:hypothetical protein Tco_0144804 [Tanacetum coccineum]
MKHPSPNNNYVPQPTFDTNFMQQPMQNPDEITDPTTAINMALNANKNGNGNVIAAQAEGNGNGNNGDIDEIEEVKANFILMANLQQASTSDIQTDKAPVYDLDGSDEVHHYKNCYDNEIFNMFTQKEHVKHNGGTLEQHPATVEETHAYFESLYNNLETKVKKANTINLKIKEANADLTTELKGYKGQEMFFEFNQENLKNLKMVIKKATKFIRDLKSLAKEADEPLDKITALEKENECLLRAVVSQDIMSILQSPSVVNTSDLQT